MAARMRLAHRQGLLPAQLYPALPALTHHIFPPFYPSVAGSSALAGLGSFSSLNAGMSGPLTNDLATQCVVSVNNLSNPGGLSSLTRSVQSTFSSNNVPPTVHHPESLNYSSCGANPQ